MLAIFPGFLFRKCYYKGEFSKQFNQSKDIDKLLWNIFFSGLSILNTSFLIYVFKAITGLEVLSSLNYENFNGIIDPISKNNLPAKKIIENTYRDLFTLIALIYYFSATSGFLCNWIVITFRLHVRTSFFRFKNYWHYYIHGGSLIYRAKSNRINEFTIADILCNCGGQNILYKGIISQYTINDSNGLENIFLTEARTLLQKKNEFGFVVNTIERDIAGAAFCIPYNTVLNMNFVYVYRSERPKPFNQFYSYSLNILFILAFMSSILLIFFDLSKYGVDGFWEKTWCILLAIILITNVRLFLMQLIKEKPLRLDILSSTVLSVSALLWLMNLTERITWWPAVITTIIYVMVVGFLGNKNKVDDDNAYIQ
ncbi:hypothetical protein ACFOWA_20065 [Pedobacter lithocola]|uniref:Uncharacterized protein n=1 Tax=Pedobacter lithocola TaxID=1908239 RepID=A0ABV8PHG4_9SPHI